MITVKDILNKYSMEINTKEIKDEFLNIELVRNMSIDDVEKIGYRNELERILILLLLRISKLQFMIIL